MIKIIAALVVGLCTTGAIAREYRHHHPAAPVVVTLQTPQPQVLQTLPVPRLPQQDATLIFLPQAMPTCR